MKRLCIRAGGTVLALLAFQAAGPAKAATAGDVVRNYADIAHAGYGDSLVLARELGAAIDSLLASPSQETLDRARQAWIVARVPYQQTEVYRFGNLAVDEWEGKVNAWPLDEGLIDYVADLYGEESELNAFYTANVIANPQLSIGGREIDASEITPDLIRSLHEIDEVEANVSTGYHAIEFLLWGQDLNGTDAGAGERPWTDFATGDNCTGGNCDRRGAYLEAASTLLLADLEEMTASWGEGGAARSDLLGRSPEEGLSVILTGMGSLSYGEQAGERMQLGLMLHDPEEEHDCFSDNTHNSHYFDALGIRNVYLGRYVRPDGSEVSGPGLAGLVADHDPELDKEMQAKLEATMAAMETLKETAEGGMAYDQMIGSGNDEGNAIVQAAIDGLVDQTRSIERIVSALGLERIEFEGSDSLDNPQAVFQ
ncbi:MAG: imelysin family protein [Geminicoccaceae bacterium]